MAGNLATKQENTVGCDFYRFNGELVQPAHTVGWAYLKCPPKNVIGQ